MSKPLVSIIVPVYNSEKWIDKCINSVLNQSYADFELILVDDGSMDSSFCIMQQYALKDKRIQVYHKDNSGVSDTRNFGINHANGDWITFVDSDDCLSASFLEKTLPSNDCVDLVVCGAIIKNKDVETNNLFVQEKRLEDGVYRIQEVYNIFTNQVFNGPVRKLFKRSVISDNVLLFPINKSYGEDTDFVYSYLNYVDSVQIVNYYGYIVNLVNDCSLSANVEALKYYATIKHNFQLYSDFLKKKHIDCSENIETYYDSNILKSASLSYWRKGSLNYGERISIYKELYSRIAWKRIRLPKYFRFLGAIQCWFGIDFLRKIHYAFVILIMKIKK